MAGKVKREPAAAADPGRDLDLGMLSLEQRQAIRALLEENAQLRIKLDRANKRAKILEELADRDTLLPVLNRRAFVRELRRIRSFNERYGLEGSVLYFDINNMKQINDGFGHAAGDAALLHVAQSLLTSVRSSDVVGRLGGDEFGVILARSDGSTAKVKAAALADRVAAAPLHFEGQAMRIEISFGIHTLSPGESIEDVLKAADEAMYEQKRGSGEGESP